MSDTNIVWTRDLARAGAAIGVDDGIDRGWILKIEGDDYRKGFSVEAPEAFKKALETVCKGVTQRVPKENVAVGVESKESGAKIEAKTEVKA